jgi:DNA repair protein RecN (Recombination protein N)
MLLELTVRDLGVIEHSTLYLGTGMTVLTGETGAGKTMIVQAIQALMGGKTDQSMVRSGSSQAVVEGRFEQKNGTEIVLRRVIPIKGRSRSYIDGQMASAAEMSSLGEQIVDLHGQHQHQSLLSPRVQRDFLDKYSGINLSTLSTAKSNLSTLLENLNELGGDDQSRQREIDFCKFQIAEIDVCQISNVDELNDLERLEDLLADAAAHILEGSKAHILLAGDLGAFDQMSAAINALNDRQPYAEIEKHLRSVSAELLDAAEELRVLVERIEDDPKKLNEVRERRQSLLDLCRKYGGTLSEVLSFRENVASKLESLSSHDESAQRLQESIKKTRSEIAREAKNIAVTRKKNGPILGQKISSFLPSLALANGLVTFAVDGDDPADQVEVRFRANSGDVERPLAKVASGGELARVMLAIRLVLSSGPATLVFDEVDAGVGGEAALALGRALASLASNHQVLVVTHLPQVGAFADQHVVVEKEDDGVSVSSTLKTVSGNERVIELARMLAGQPESKSGQKHAIELLEIAAAQRQNA